MREQIRKRLSHRLRGVFPEISTDFQIKIDEPPDSSMGDFSTNIAIVLAGKLKQPPRQIAEKIVEKWGDTWFEKVEAAGPGFINFFISLDGWREWVAGIIEGKEDFFAPPAKKRKIHLEFVSANPTGPLHVGHGRGAALGDTLGRLLKKIGYDVFTEYYINDGGRQIDNLGESVYLRYKELFGEKVELRNDHYKGDYVIEIAKEIKEKYGDKFLEKPDPSFFSRYAAERILSWIRKDLELFRVRFDSWFSERRVYDEGIVSDTLNILREKGLTYEKDGALWFKSSNFGDEKDRVLIRSNGDPTYFLADIAYHRLKFEGGYDLIIDIWGADHHGYEPRIRAAMKALGFDDRRIRILFIQLVSLKKGGETISMSTRTGEFVTLKEVLEEVGVDASRFFFLLRRNDSHLDFDLDLARKQSSENPVYYVQYAHARISSIFQQAVKKRYSVKNLKFDMGVISRKEIPLLKKISEFNEILESGVRDLTPHRIPFYLVELARQFHQYYNEVRVLVEDEKERSSRLLLAKVVQDLIREGLDIIGVSAPEKM